MHINAEYYTMHFSKLSNTALELIPIYFSLKTIQEKIAMQLSFCVLLCVISAMAAPYNYPDFSSFSLDPWSNLYNFAISPPSYQQYIPGFPAPFPTQSQASVSYPSPFQVSAPMIPVSAPASPSTDCILQPIETCVFFNAKHFFIFFYEHHLKL